jgi:excisionase family DNA binding protein
MQFSLGIPPEFINQLAAGLLTSLQVQIKAAAEAAVVHKDADILFNVKEAAVRLKMCEKTVLAKIEAGKLSAANLGTWERPQYRISKADLIAFYNINKA